jgi:hypothetical protein
MKKGQAQNYFMVITIITVLALVLGMILFTTLGGKVRENQDVTDAFCKSRITALSSEMEDGGFNLMDSLITLSEAFRASCIPQTEIIDPQNWDACDSSFKEQSKTEPTAAATNCAMHQVADKIERCWDMSGEGRRTAFSWACFNIVISEASEVPEINEYADFKNQIIKSFNCPLFGGGECKEYAKDAIEDATILAAYNNLIDMTESTALAKIEACRMYEPKETEEEPTDEELSAEYALLNKRDEEIYLELTPSNTRPVLRKYMRDEIVQIGDQEVDCTLNTLAPEFKTKLEELETLRTTTEPYKNSVLLKYNSAHDLDLGELPFQLQKDTRLETDTIQFTEAELKNFMKDVPIQGRITNYCSTISYRGHSCDNRVEYYPQGFKVKQNIMFSVEYCGDALPLGSNIVATTICNRGVDQRRILISDTPTGGGSRLINENLNMNCPILEAVSEIKLPGISNPFEPFKKACQDGVARTLLSA